ncbi:hypothetical protein Clacol_010092 [Clathrus columnatus]|uniref:Rho-GAP domain-containing protein n=1 Tax=Clathrus columnatus TaxID=1419009 RepID=A0AAV5ARP1_9AGAM|nr:hypothetical protein Clacol_010092 [Clathrus columnatus]
MRSSQISTNLKQKLSALSQAIPSSPSTSTPTSPSRAKFKDLIPSAWRRHTNNGFHPQTPTNESESQFDLLRLDHTMSKLIFQAGVDFEVVMAACAFPDPATVSYDILLSCREQTQPFMELDMEGISQFEPKVPQELEKIVVFSLAGTLISPKFFQKIQYCRTLSDLAIHVPLTQIDIPPEVYKENLAHEDRIKLPVPPLSLHFGVPLDELMGVYGEKGGIPRVVRDCVTYLREYGMEQNGLFRRSPSSAVLKQIKEAYDRGQTVSLETYCDPNLAAVLLKMFFRDLPQPIFPESIYSIIRQCPSPSEEDGDVACITYIRDTILPALGSFSAVVVLSYVLNLLHDISLRADTNKMTSHNLAIVFSPNLVKSSNPIKDVEMCAVPGGPSMSVNMRTPVNNAAVPKANGRSAGTGTIGMVIKCCIERYFEIFDEVPDRSEAIPVPDTLLHSMISTPSSSGPGLSNRAAAAAGTTTQSPALSRGEWPNNKRSNNANNTNNNTAGWTSRSAMDGTSYSFATVRRARSVISIEKNSGPMTASGTRRGTIRLGSGKGTIKSPAAGVEALGVNAAGFFSPPT